MLSAHERDVATLRQEEVVHTAQTSEPRPISLRRNAQ
jgi:hypothetical protein